MHYTFLSLCLQSSSSSSSSLPQLPRRRRRRPFRMRAIANLFPLLLFSFLPTKDVISFFFFQARRSRSKKTILGSVPMFLVYIPPPPPPPPTPPLPREREWMTIVIFTRKRDRTQRLLRCAAKSWRGFETISNATTYTALRLLLLENNKSKSPLEFPPPSTYARRWIRTSTAVVYGQKEKEKGAYHVTRCIIQFNNKLYRARSKKKKKEEEEEEKGVL